MKRSNYNLTLGNIRKNLGILNAITTKRKGEEWRKSRTSKRNKGEERRLVLHRGNGKRDREEGAQF